MSTPSYCGSAAATSVIMSPSIRNSPVVFVEGSCEIRLISHHHPAFESQVVSCGGHSGVKDAISTIEIWEKSNGTRLRVLGFIDRDYGKNGRHKRIVFTNNRDLEIDLYLTTAGEKLLKEKSSKSKCPNPRSTLTLAMQEMKVVGLVRKYNCDNGLFWRINDINLERCLNPDGTLKNEKFLNDLKQINRIGNTEFIELRSYLDSNPNIRVESILRGHDLSLLLGKWLRGKIGNRGKDETSWGCLEENLRLASNDAELLNYNWARRIKNHLASR